MATRVHHHHLVISRHVHQKKRQGKVMRAGVRGAETRFHHNHPVVRLIAGAWIDD